MNSIGVFAAPAKPRAIELALQLVSLAERHNIEVRLQSSCACKIKREDLGTFADEEVAASDILAVFGGDGTVLYASRMAAPHKTPILAVDLGRLGFLSAVHPGNLEAAFEHLLQHQFVVEERMMLQARVLRADKSHVDAASDNPTRHDIGGSIGLNDAVVAKSALARILHLSIYIDGRLAAETRGDGLIVSTPTGSTGYALSAGGPIVHPNVPLLLICPICPHSLTQRPIVVGPDETLDILAEWDGDEVAASQLEAMLTVDGQIGIGLQPGDIVRVQRAEVSTCLLRPPDSNFYARLREKMRWGAN